MSRNQRFLNRKDSVLELFEKPGDKLRFSEISDKLFPKERYNLSKRNNENVKLVRKLKGLVSSGYLEKVTKSHKYVSYVATEKLVQERAKKLRHYKVDAVMNAKSKEDLDKALIDLLQILRRGLSQSKDFPAAMSTMGMMENAMTGILKISSNDSSANKD